MSDEVAYLRAKRTVDDRALNRRVLEEFETRLVALDTPIRILEVGAGTGTMPRRLAAWGMLPDDVRYRCVDRNPESVAAARERIPTELATHGYEVDTDESGRAIRATRDGSRLEITVEEGDAIDAATAANAVIGCAFFDLVSLPDTLSALREAAGDQTHLYAPITFDGLTGFVPAHPLDESIVLAYHRHMRERDQPGGPAAGRALLEAVSTVGGEVLGAGGADWIVRPVDGSYPGEERHVIETVLETMKEALTDLQSNGLYDGEFHEWLTTRRRQAAAGQLTVIAHNLDVLCRL